MIIDIPRPLAQALASALYNPFHDSNGHSVYHINVNIAYELRLALAEALEKKDETKA